MNFNARLKALEKWKEATPDDDETRMNKSWLESIQSAYMDEIKAFGKHLLADEVTAWLDSFRVYDNGAHDVNERFLGLLSVQQLRLWVRFSKFLMG
jgi:hypothetical protein